MKRTPRPADVASAARASAVAVALGTSGALTRSAIPRGYSATGAESRNPMLRDLAAHDARDVVDHEVGQAAECLQGRAANVRQGDDFGPAVQRIGGIPGFVPVDVEADAAHHAVIQRVLEGGA